MIMRDSFLRIAGISGALAVTLGAMGAHYLKTKVAAGIISAENLQSYQTGVQYQMYHSLALLVLSFFPYSKAFRAAGILFIIGILLFSGSIYILSLRNLFNLQGLTWLGPITPLGGLSFIAGWIMITTRALKNKKQNEL